MRQILVVALIVGCAACVSENSATSKTTAEPDTARRAYVDPDTGELVAPAPQQAPEARKAAVPADASTESGYIRETRPDGTVLLRPKDPARHVIEAKRDDDGNVTIRERDDHAQ